MKRTARLFLGADLALALPTIVFAISSGPPIRRTGAAVDGGVTCTACHRDGGAANSGPGRLRIVASGYQPGVKQNLRVIVDQPGGQRWGFQLTARLASAPAQQAGAFTVNPDTRVRCDSGGPTPATTEAPCNGLVEFASHTSASTRPGTASPGIFTVEWTPPAQDMGDIVFYAAGNGSNGSGNPLGDRIYTTSRTIPACTSNERPALRAAPHAVNAADGRATVASNTLISIFGSAFAPAARRLAWGRSDVASDAGADRLAPELGCLAVEIGGQRAPILYVQNDQINAQAPILAPSGTAEVVVITNPGRPNEMRSPAGTVQLGVYSPAFFTFDGRSIAALNLDASGGIVADSSLYAGAAPARPGQVVRLFGTGFGYSDPVFQPGEFPFDSPRIRDPFTLTIGGIPVAAADILFFGLSGSAPGLFHLDVRLPAALPDGDAAVVVRMGGVETQAGAKIPVRR
ncbi:MAG: hypothetical protein FJW37_05290 [Acidobacteria bacterium]|nr:hypothetical protein [Acidobacteriota bacterium]